MPVPIAEDWKAINDRMQQIRAERSAVSGPCRMCNGLGWVPDLSVDRRSREARVVPCSLCRNPRDLAPPEFIPRR
jgi:hypothetical protein